MAKPLVKKGNEKRPVEVNGQVRQVQVYERTVEIVEEVDVETLKMLRARLQAKLDQIDAEIAEIEAAGG